MKPAPIGPLDFGLMSLGISVLTLVAARRDRLADRLLVLLNAPRHDINTTE